jgi:nucleoside-diphosphate-sugar epimerase
MIFITGANGWLGLNLIKSIVNGHSEKWGLKTKEITAIIKEGTSRTEINKISQTVKIVHGDVSSPESINDIFKNAKDSIVIHTAAIIHPKKVSEFYQVNYQGTKNILSSCEKYSVKKLILISSNSPCGCNSNNMEQFNEQSPYRPYMNYGKSKMLMEILAMDFYNKGKLDLTILRAPWFYGPFQPARQVLFYKMIQKGKVPLVGNGQNKRSMVFTENLVQGIILAATRKVSSGQIYWIADEEPYTMNEIITTIENLLEKDFKIKCSGKRIRLPGIVSEISEISDCLLQSLGFYNQKIHVLSEMNKNIICSIEQAKQDLNYSPSYTIHEGMRISISEIIDNLH